MNTYQAMIKARNLIRRPMGWTKMASKRKRPNGVTAYCASGACFEAAQATGVPTSTLMDFLREAIPSGKTRDVIQFNDYHVGTQKRAIAWFQRAVRKAAKANGLQVQC
jgi:hypothetical protein